MNKNDFKKGQKVYLKYIGDRRRGTIGSITETTVKSIGSKYITTTDGDSYAERKFDIANDFREFYTIGGTDYQLYLSKEQIEEENESKVIIKLIVSQFNDYSYKTKLSIDQLRRIKSIIDEK